MTLPKVAIIPSWDRFIRLKIYLQTNIPKKSQIKHKKDQKVLKPGAVSGKCELVFMLSYPISFILMKGVWKVFKYTERHAFMCVNILWVQKSKFSKTILLFLLFVGFVGWYRYALALRASLGGPLLGVALRGEAGASLTMLSHALWHASRVMKLLPLP